MVPFDILKKWYGVFFICQQQILKLRKWLVFAYQVKSTRKKRNNNNNRTGTSEYIQQHFYIPLPHYTVTQSLNPPYSRDTVGNYFNGTHSFGV